MINVNGVTRVYVRVGYVHFLYTGISDINNETFHSHSYFVNLTLYKNVSKEVTGLAVGLLAAKKKLNLPLTGYFLAIVGMRVDD